MDTKEEGGVASVCYSARVVKQVTPVQPGMFVRNIKVQKNQILCIQAEPVKLLIISRIDGRVLE